MEIKPISKKTMIGLSILSIVAGILFCFLGKDLLYILFTILGALVVVGGIFAFVKLDIISGVLGVTLGALMILGAWLFVDILLIINGIFLCVSGAFGFFVSIKNEDAKKCILSVLILALGILFFVTKAAVVDWIFFVIGALFIVSGIFGLILVLVHPKEKKIKTVDVKEIKEGK